MVFLPEVIMSDNAKIGGLIGGGMCLLGGLIALIYFVSKPTAMLEGECYFCLPVGLYCVGKGIFLISSALLPSNRGTSVGS